MPATGPGQRTIDDGHASLRLIAFAGAANWPVWAGNEHGMFAREGLAVEHALTPNSRAMALDLSQGRADIALTSIDNVVAYNEAQGEADLAGPTDFVAVMGVDDGFLNLMARPGIETIADLKGRSLSVDALSTGFAFVLRELLGRGGLADNDVEYVRVGGGAERLKALLAGEQSATLLNSPLDLLAEAAGCRRIARARDALGAYQGIVAAARRGWTTDNAVRIEAFIRGFHDALAWLAAPQNKAAAIALLQARMPALGDAAAERACGVLLDPISGMRRDLGIDPAGVATVLRLRSRYATPAKVLSDPARYVDDAFRRRAIA